MTYGTNNISVESGEWLVDPEVVISMETMDFAINTLFNDGEDSGQRRRTITFTFRMKRKFNYYMINIIGNVLSTLKCTNAHMLI